MSLLKVKDKFQVTLPPEAREELGLEIGDYLEASVERGKITLTPKSVIDRSIARAIEDVKRKRVRGPFSTADQVVKSMRKSKRRSG